MASPRPDRRTARTRQALTSAFVELLLERGYAKVTVADVAERANIGRSTLYAHFGSLEGMLRVSLSGPSSHLVAILDPATTVDAVVPILEHFRDQRRLNRVFFDPPIRGLWVRRLAEMIEERLAQRRGGDWVLPVSLVARQVAEGQLALVIGWLGERSVAVPARAVAEALVATTRATVKSLMAGEPG